MEKKPVNYYPPNGGLFGLGLAILLFLCACQPVATAIPTTQPAPTAKPSPITVADLGILFKGDGCTYQGPNTIKVGDFSFKVENLDKAHDAYGLAVLTLYEGKTFADIQAWPSSDKPSWSELVAFRSIKSGESNSFIVNVKRGPIYLVCFFAKPDTKTGVFGPIEVQQ